MYIVELLTGEYEDTLSEIVFITKDLEYAERWKARYESLIERQREIINKKYDDPLVYLHDLIRYYYPRIRIITAEERG